MSSVALLLLAATAVQLAVGRASGAYDHLAIVLVALGIVALAIAARRELKEPAGLCPSPLAGSLSVWAGLTAMLVWGGCDLELILYAEGRWIVGRVALLLMLVLVLTYLPAIRSGRHEPPWFVSLRIVALFVLAAIAGLDTLRASPQPKIDVWLVLQQGSSALLHGQNPYTNVSVPDSSGFGGGQATPFVYPPTQAVVGLLGYALFGDVRYSMLLAVMATGLCCRHLTGRAAGTPTFLVDAPALYIVCAPNVFFVLEQSWVDPCPLLLITLAITLAATKRPLASAVLFGLAVSSKQTLFWIAPLAALALGFGWRRWATMLISALVPLVPFAVWNFRAMKYSMFDFLVALPSRPDGLTIINFVNRTVGTSLQGGAAMPLAVVVCGLGLWRVRRLSSLGVLLPFLFIVYFAFNRWAFANYYFFVSGLCSVGAAAFIGTAPRDEPQRAAS